MSNAAILYLRLLRRIVRDVRESAWRLGGGEETFLAEGFGGGDGPVVHRGGGRTCAAGDLERRAAPRGQTRNEHK